jgi:hypothetical protein
VASSADGRKLYAAEFDPTANFGSIYASTNAGVTWNQTSAPSNSWSAVACSADGTKLVAAAGIVPGYDNQGPLLFSTNSAKNWTQASVTNESWVSVSISADGTKMVAAAYNANFFVSTNSGGAWVQVNASFQDVTHVAITPDGTQLLAMGGVLAISADWGESWQQFPRAPISFPFPLCFAISADGNRLVAADDSGIYTWHPVLFKPPQLKIDNFGGAPRLSWIVPSSDFLLEETPNLSVPTWVAVSNAPSLDLTTLRNELSISPSLRGSFFRVRRL